MLEGFSPSNLSIFVVVGRSRFPISKSISTISGSNIVDSINDMLSASSPKRLDSPFPHELNASNI